MFYSLKIYNELKRQEINLPWTAQSPKTFTANCKSYNKSSSGFTAIIKFEFMHIASPVPLREYNVKFTVTLFSYENDNLYKWNTDKRERYQESLIWIDFFTCPVISATLCYRFMLHLFKQKHSSPPPQDTTWTIFVLLIFSCKWIDIEKTHMKMFEL